MKRCVFNGAVHRDLGEIIDLVPVDLFRSRSFNFRIRNFHIQDDHTLENPNQVCYKGDSVVYTTRVAVTRHSTLLLVLAVVSLWSIFHEGGYRVFLSCPLNPISPILDLP